MDYGHDPITLRALRRLFGAVFDHLWTQNGMPASKLARHSQITESYLSHMRKGRRVPAVDTAQRLGHALGVGDLLVTLLKVIDDESRGGRDGGRTVEPEEVTVQRRTMIQHSLGALAISATSPDVALEAVRQGIARAVDADSDDWQQIADDYARDYYTTSPVELLTRLRTDFVVLQRQMADLPEDEDLARAAALLAIVVARSLVNLGQAGTARRWWATARHTASTCGDLDTQLLVAGWRVTSGVVHEGCPPERMIALADEALAVSSSRHACAGTGQILGMRAQSLALVGRHNEAAAGVRAVEEITAKMPTRVLNDAESMFGWPVERLHHTASHVYSTIGDMKQATEAQDKAFDLYPANQVKNRTMVEMHRAVCMIKENDIGGGLRYATDAFDAMPVEMREPGLRQLAHQVLATTPAPEQSRLEARELRALVSAPSPGAMA